MKVDDIPIDNKLKQHLKKQGISELFPPQAEAIEKGLLDDQNIVVAIPTASGKTLIAILAIFSAISRYPGSKAIYLAPLRALAAEKYQEFREFADLLGMKVAISTGDLDENSRWLHSADIIIATNEKFDSLIRHQVSWLNDIRVVVSDEVHLINDSTRGPVLEVVLSLIMRNLPQCQIVALSATIINADEIAEWLDAELILSTWRPIKLIEGVWSQGILYLADGTKKEVADPSDSNGYVSLSCEIVTQGGQALVFANTRKSAMASADALSKKLPKLLSSADLNRLHEIASQIRSIGEKTQIREKLAAAVENGVAFHHAGLISSHRKIIEAEFRNRVIKVICATPTLAAGVNLPGRRVIIRSLSRYSQNFGYNPIPVLEYKQMAGRAGRPKYDPYGEAIIIAKNKDEVDHFMERYVLAETEEIYSKLGYEPALRAHILAFIAAEYVDSFETALDMVQITFYGYQNEGSLYLVEEEVLKVFDLLAEAKLITANEPYMVTPFGKRVSELYLDPLSARIIKNGLEMGNELETIPEIVYLQLLATTPDIRSYSVRQKDMPNILDIANRYSDLWLEDLDSMGEFETDLFFSTIKVADTINMWLEEKTEEEIYIEYGTSSGDLHSMLQRMEWLLHCAAEIAKIFQWKHHRKVLLRLQKRIKYGVNEELLKLVEIRGIGRIRARTLFDNGYKTVAEVKNASLTALASLPGFGEKIAKQIKQNLGEEFDDEEGIVIENEDSNAQSSLSSYF